jgi:alpha-N-arabinofuranosidase
MTATEYATAARKWAHGLKLVDPSIQLISCGETGWSDWDREVLQSLVPFIDHHSIHFYTMLGCDAGWEYEKNVFGPAAAERGIEIAAALVDLANIDNTFRGIPARQVKIAFDEWNVWDDKKAGACLEQRYDYSDMLGVCAWLNLLVRKHAVVEIACLAQSVNVIAPVMTSPTGIMRQTIFWP